MSRVEPAFLTRSGERLGPAGTHLPKLAEHPALSLFVLSSDATSAEVGYRSPREASAVAPAIGELRDSRWAPRADLLSAARGAHDSGGIARLYPRCRQRRPAWPAPARNRRGARPGGERSAFAPAGVFVPNPPGDRKARKAPLRTIVPTARRPATASATTASATSFAGVAWVAAAVASAVDGSWPWGRLRADVLDETQRRLTRWGR
jgi:hypothetical protein